MRTSTYAPMGHLRPYIELFWHYEGREFCHEKERVLPDGSVELVINLKSDTLRVYHREDVERVLEYRGCLLSGPHSSYMVIDTESQDAIMGIHFRPGGAFPFFGLPMDELHNLHLSLEELWGRDAGDVHEQLVMAPDAEARFELLEGHLLGLLWARASLGGHPSVRYALEVLQAHDAPSVAEVTEEVGLSARRMIQLFRREVGLTPKRFARIHRFQRLLHHLPRSDKGLAELALDFGYYDQAHLNRDFRDFAGLSPTAYLHSQRSHPNHVALEPL